MRSPARLSPADDRGASSRLLHLEDCWYVAHVPHGAIPLLNGQRTAAECYSLTPNLTKCQEVMAPFDTICIISPEAPAARRARVHRQRGGSSRRSSAMPHREAALLRRADHATRRGRSVRMPAGCRRRWGVASCYSQQVGGAGSGELSSGDFFRWIASQWDL
jgi:hypothetical protein